MSELRREQGERAGRRLQSFRLSVARHFCSASVSQRQHICGRKKEDTYSSFLASHPYKVLGRWRTSHVQEQHRLRPKGFPQRRFPRLLLRSWTSAHRTSHVAFCSYGGFRALTAMMHPLPIARSHFTNRVWPPRRRLSLRSTTWSAPKPKTQLLARSPCLGSCSPVVWPEVARL